MVCALSTIIHHPSCLRTPARQRPPQVGRQSILECGVLLYRHAQHLLSQNTAVADRYKQQQLNFFWVASQGNVQSFPNVLCTDKGRNSSRCCRNLRRPGWWKQTFG